jgi:CHASE2 domain-containing sensor protein/class 3 adenylate cyclase
MDGNLLMGTTEAFKQCKNWLGRLFFDRPAVLPGVVAAVLSVGMWQLGLWQPLERQGYNTLFEARNAGLLPHKNWDERIVVIAIDNASLEKYGKFPWSRDRHAKLLQILSRDAPAAIGFDILFVDPGSGDTEFAKAMVKAGNVVLSTAWDRNKGHLEVLPELKAAALGEGQIWHNADPDGVSRKAAVFNSRLPGLGLAILQASNPSNVSLPQPPVSEGRQDVWINWPGRTEDATTYSYMDVVEGRVPTQAWAGKLVLVGVTATAVDPLRSPFDLDPPTAGVYLHAALLDNLLNNRLLQTLPQLAVILLLLGIGPTSSWLLSKQGLRGRLALFVGLPAIWFALALTLLSWQHQWLPVAAPAGTMMLAGVSLQLREQQEKQQLMKLFATHVSPQMAKHIWQHKTEIFQKGKLQAQEMTATVLFADMRSFTSISEKLPPCELLSWLNQYMDAMTSCITKHDGIIDKYIGDGIMAVFGIPFARTQPEAICQDAQNAIAAAIAMQQQLQQLNQRFQEMGQPIIEIGIGIHTGLVVAGSIGGTQRLSYSVLGDTVNIAARLEPINKQVKVNNPYNLIVSGTTFGYVRDRYDAYLCGGIQLRGREEVTMIYSISGEASSSPARLHAITPQLDLSA